MNNLLKKIMEKWAKLSAAKKSAAAVMLICIILASSSFLKWATKVEYAPLFTNMQADSAGSMVEKLKEMNVSYRLSDEGRTILVPQERVYDLRLELASEGVFSSGGMGFELFDNSPLGTTDFERHLNYQRALQEELRRTIIQLDAVEQARVHLVIPEKSVFIEDEGRASASIFVNLRPMSNLESHQIKGIMELVANSVNNLNIEDVTIVDTDGNVLNKYVAGDSKNYSAAQLRQMDLKKNFENNLERRIQYLLERMYGNGKVVVMVTADLDFNQKEVTRIEWGDQGVIRSEQLIKENDAYSQASNPVGEDNRESGIPEQSLGGEENEDESVDTYTTIDDKGENSSSRIESISNYELDKTEERIVYAPGRLMALSTAVTVDGKLSQEKIESIKKLVSAATGYTPERGDKITVLSMKFDKSKTEEAQALMAKAAQENKSKETLNFWLNWGLKIFGIIFIFILLLVIIRSIRSIHERPKQHEIQNPTPIEEVEEEIETKKTKNKMTRQMEKAQQISDKKPEEAIQILKTWLAED